MSRIAESPAFDVCGELPSGVTVLEASAGTGKTYAIAALAARYIADGIPIDHLLMVTFGRMATGELRERVRRQLNLTEQGLGRALAGADNGAEDPVIALLTTGGEGELATRRSRLRRALADFDSATIATTHGFCEGVLQSVGMAADLDPDVTFVDNLTDLTEEVLDDLYVRRFHGRDTPPFNRQEALEIARIAVTNPLAPLEPRNAPAESVSAMRMRLAQAVREEIETRKRRGRLMSYDDLLTHVRSAIVEQTHIDVSVRLRTRHRIVLVDEFQDTDPVQWEIVRRAFAGEVILVLVADPKQAIYAFRGADVYSYLEAAKSATTRATLRVNWRSDQALLDAYDALFADAKLGDEGILYRQVSAAEENKEPRLSCAPVNTAFRVRIVNCDEPTIDLTRTGYATKQSAREHVAIDVAADIVRTLSSKAQIERRARDGSARGHELVRPGHIAVLVRTHKTAAQVRDELEKVRVPAVINGAGSVFGTAAAREWLRLLEAIERPTADQRARSAALTSFFGWSAERVAEADEHAWESVHRQIHRWASILRTRGVASLMASINLVEGLPARVLTQVDGERQLTDLRHIGQLLHNEAVSEGMGAAALTDWLQERVADAEGDTADEERSRRLESDAEAVQILTIHRSKGLEFPIVYCPFLWDPAWVPDDVPVYFHDPAGGDRRTLDVGVGGDDFDAHFRQHLIEQRGEELRLAYVALTRAKQQSVIWWAGSYDAKDSPLGRLLFEKDSDGNIAAFGSRPVSDETAHSRISALHDEAPDAIAVEESKLSRRMLWEPTPAAAGHLSLASFERGVDWSWRRTSFSDITSGSDDATVASEPRERVLDDEPVEPWALATGRDDAEQELKQEGSRFQDLPVSLGFGTLVHRLLERADFAAPDLEEELTLQLAGLQGSLAGVGADRDELVGALSAAIETPLGAAVGDLPLRELARGDRLDELVFELPLVGGDCPDGHLTLDVIASALSRSEDDRLRAYADRLRDPTLRQSVRGYLTGSIDLVGRIAGAGGPRFFIVDYKTNWLGQPGESLTAWHYRQHALSTEMVAHHYLLQGTLYAAALHRFLRWRVPGYEPARDFAGVVYVFLRGMSGRETPRVDGQPCGVFSWQPPPVLLDELSRALATGGGS